MPCDDTEDSKISQPRRKLGGKTSSLASNLQNKDMEDRSITRVMTSDHM